MIRIFIIKLLLLLTYTIYGQIPTPFAIHSGTSHVLYINCSNSIALTLLPCANTLSTKSVKLVADNATVAIDSISNNTFFTTIIPNESSPKLTLNAYNGLSLIGSETFVVKYLPAPEIHLLTQGKQIAIKNGFYGMPKDLTIQVALNEDVQDIISVQPKYKITSFEIRFVKTGTELKKIQVNDNTIDLRTIKHIESTEYLIITINEIKIVMPDGELKNIRYGNSILTIPIIH